VSKVIKTLLPADYSKVDPTVLEIARLRGSFVDTYFSEWLTDPLVTMDLPTVKEMIAPMFPREHDKHAEDTIMRIDNLLDWWTDQGWKVRDVQRTVFSEADGIAGTFDMGTEEFIFDLKCVSSLQPNYSLQLGAYSTMDPQAFPLRDVAIIHVMKDKVKLVKYKTKQCREQWKACLGWYKTLGEFGSRT
jgi:hypothetical protein